MVVIFWEEIFIVSGRMSMVSASTRMYKKKPGMVVYARKSTRNARIPWPIIPHSSAKDCWNTKKKNIMYRRSIDEQIST